MKKEQTVPFVSHYHRPTMKLYRYFSNMKHAINEIERGEIYCSLSDSFNDIFDCKIVNNGIVLDTNVKAKKTEILSLVNRILCDCEDFFIDYFQKHNDFAEMKEQFLLKTSKCSKVTPRQYLQFVHAYAEREDNFSDFYDIVRKSYITKQPIISLTSRVACFSEVNDSILMWSYYADKHQGICLEYDPTLLNDGSTDNKNLFNAFQKVHYSEKQYNDLQYMHSSSDLESTVFTKALCWAHEQEWRIAIAKDIKYINMPCLTGIYLGARFREKYLRNDIFNKVVRKACIEKNKIAVYEAIPDNKEYKINFSTIIPVRTDGEI